MQHNSVNTAVVALAAVGVILSGCAGKDDASSASPTATAHERPADVDEPAVTDRGSRTSADAEQTADPPFGESAVQASPQDLSSDATTNRTAVAGEQAGDAEGGLFGAEPPPPDIPDDRLDDNTFADYGYRDFVAVATDPLSTFALDVDTGSYTVGRRWLEEGRLPPRESVRPEEYLNAFDYAYDAPRSGLELTVDGGPSPFDVESQLVRVGVQGEIVDDRDRGPASLTFVVDTSGSMDRDDRLGLVKKSLEILVDELHDDDTVAIVTYDDDSGVVLEPTSVRDRERILDAIDRLRPGGSTNLESGLREGYRLAGESFMRDGINRVVLASDGVANVGDTDPDRLAEMIREDADRGIDLVTVGFGMGNFNDVTMEQLADQGDGFYAYVDTDDEAERLFEDELTSTLLTIAKDAKIQVEFDPAIVESYRLIGFENRGVLDSEFRDDSVDAGELGAGHQVTAMYEVRLRRDVSLAQRGDIGEVLLRWADPDTGDVVEIDADIDLRDVEPDWTQTPDDFQLATVVTAFAELLRENPYAVGVDIDALARESSALASRLDDRDVDELADLIATAARLR